MSVPRPALLLILMCMVPAAKLHADESPREAYLILAQAAYERGLASCEDRIEEWRRCYKPTEKTGYCPPAEPVWLANLAASLYNLTGREEYAREAIHRLACHHEFKSAFPDSLRAARPEYARGVPALTDFYQVPYFARAYLYVRDAPCMTDDARKTIQHSIAESADFMLSHAEWGPHEPCHAPGRGIHAGGRRLSGASAGGELAQARAPDRGRQSGAMEHRRQ